MDKIYAVLLKFCDARGYTPSNVFEKQELASEIASGVVVISAKARDDRDVTIMLLKSKHGAMSRQDDMKRLLRYPGEKIIISDTEPKSNIASMVAQHKDKISIYNRKAFLTDIRQNINAPRHELVEKPDIPEPFYNPAELPNIMVNDPQVVWLGAVPGDIIKITEYDKNAGIAVRYRMVTA